MTAADVDLQPGHAEALAIVAGTPSDHFCMPTNSTRPWSQGQSSLVHYLAAGRLNWYGLVSYANGEKSVHLTDAGRRLCEHLGIEVGVVSGDRRFRVRALIHHDDGASHPDWGRLYSQDRRLSYHRTLELAEARAVRIMAEHGTTRQCSVGAIVRWVEVAARNEKGYFLPVGERRRPAIEVAS